MHVVPVGDRPDGPVVPQVVDLLGEDPVGLLGGGLPFLLIVAGADDPQLLVELLVLDPAEVQRQSALLPGVVRVPLHLLGVGVEPAVVAPPEGLEVAP